MKRFLTICICVFLCVGCTHQGGGNTGTSSTSETVVTTTTPVTTPVVDIPMPEYHEELMSGDFSAIAGEYINSEGYIMKINNEGLRTNEAEHGEVTYANGMYQMPITRRLGTNNTYTLTVYPVGLDLSSEALDTDTSKIRIHYGNSDPVSEEEVFTRIEHDTLTPPEYHEQIMSGNFSAVAGEYVNPEGKTFVLDVTGLSEGEVSSGSVRGSFTKGYAMSVGAVGAVDGLYSLFLYPVGVEITYFDGCTMFHHVKNTTAYSSRRYSDSHLVCFYVNFKSQELPLSLHLLFMLWCSYLEAMDTEAERISMNERKVME